MDEQIKAEIEMWLGGAAPTAQRVAELAAGHPTFLLPAVARLRYGTDLSAQERTALCTRLAIAAPDLEQMSLAANSELLLDLANFYPPELPETPGTDAAIEKFRATYGNPDPKEDAMLERLIFNPVPDYAQLLAREEEESLPEGDEAPEGSQDALLNSFILKHKAEESAPLGPPPAKPESAVKKPTSDDDTTLSESLAKIYIRRGDYRKAFDIISNLNLNFPEKSIYFADQLRFLGKLIAIEERKTVSNSDNN